MNKVCCVCQEDKELSEFSHIRGKPYSRCKGCDRERKRKERKLRDHSQTDRKYWLKKAYGMTPEQYIELFDKAHGRCQICGIHQAELDYHLVVDHCHKTGAIRGVLCKRCNSAIGLLDDDLARFDKCKEYLSGIQS